VLLYVASSLRGGRVTGFRELARAAGAALAARPDVPLYALLQSHADPMRRSQIIATNNVMNAFFMVVSSLIAAALLSMGLSILDFFMLLAISNGIVAFYLYVIRKNL
jgi:hypothetical protein